MIRFRFFLKILSLLHSQKNSKIHEMTFGRALQRRWLESLCLQCAFTRNIGLSLRRNASHPPLCTSDLTRTNAILVVIAVEDEDEEHVMLQQRLFALKRVAHGVCYCFFDCEAS